MPMAVMAVLALLGHSCTFFSLACRRRKPSEFQLYFVQLGCLSREVIGHPHEIFGHALKIIRGLNSQLRYRDKMITE